ncbi:hypothetical protein C8R44DRAFT_871484 [Mycena epipterygia]|nr:hypothetical protein C8R44DRAFT_871484 [Mycena epipterygia]
MIISPPPLIAVNSVLLSWIVTRLGACYARLTPPALVYALFFISRLRHSEERASDRIISCAILALVIQVAGGTIASDATTLPGANMWYRLPIRSPGATDVNKQPRQARRESHDNDQDTLFATLVLFIRYASLAVNLVVRLPTCPWRSIYRIIELAGGWEGRILHTEVYFNVLDGRMVVLAIIIMKIAHSGDYFARDVPERRTSFSMKIKLKHVVKELGCSLGVDTWFN